MGIFKSTKEDFLHETFGAGSVRDALEGAKEHGGAERIDGPNVGKGNAMPHVHNKDGSIINIDPRLKDPLDYDDD
jgi:hypothetical protein